MLWDVEVKLANIGCFNDFNYLIRFIYLFKMLKKDEYERILESAYYFLKRLNLIFSKEIG